MVQVSGVASSNFVLQNQTELQDRVQELRIQASTGKKSQTYDGIATSVRRLQALESDFSANEAFQRNATRTENRLKEMESSISTLEDIASQFRTQLLSAANDGGNLDSIDLEKIATTFRDEAEGVLNTEIGGRFLFAGSATKTKPVDFTGTTTVAEVKKANYFQGNGEVLSARVTETTTIDYGVTAEGASGSGAQKLLSAIQRVIDSPNSADAVEKSIRDLTGGEADVSLSFDGLTDPTQALNTNEGGGVIQGTTFSPKTIQIQDRAGGTPITGAAASSEVDINAGDTLFDVAEKITNVDGVSARVADQNGTVQLEVFSDDQDTPVDVTDITDNFVGLGGASKALDQEVDGAVDELADTRSGIGITRDLIETTQSELKDDQSRLNNDISDVEDAELQRTLTLLAEEEQSLQASYATTSRLQQTSILNFLR